MLGTSLVYFSRRGSKLSPCRVREAHFRKDSSFFLRNPLCLYTKTPFPQVQVQV